VRLFSPALHALTIAGREFAEYLLQPGTRRVQGAPKDVNCEWTEYGLLYILRAGSKFYLVAQTPERELEAMHKLRGTLADFVAGLPVLRSVTAGQQIAMAQSEWGVPPQNSNKALASLICESSFVSRPASIAAVIWAIWPV